MNKKRSVWMKNEEARWWYWVWPKRHVYREYRVSLSMWRWGCWVILRGPKDIIDMVEEESVQ